MRNEGQLLDDSALMAIGCWALGLLALFIAAWLMDMI